MAATRKFLFGKRATTTKNIGVDLGTANVLINVQGEGIVVDEPAVVAVTDDEHKVVAVGNEAAAMVGRTPENIRAIRPLKGGVIADFDMAEAMLAHFIKKMNVKGFLTRPNIMICCPTDTTDVEQKALIQAAEKSGGGQVFLEKEPKAAAIGAGLDIFKPHGSMIIDIGGGSSDIAVLSLGGIVTSASLRKAGDTFNADIAAYVKQHDNLLIGERSAEQAKVEIGTVIKDHRNDELQVRGSDTVDGMPRTITLTSNDVEAAIHETMGEIIAAAKKVIAHTPPELVGDIIESGITLTGGGAQFDGIAELFATELRVPVTVAETPLDDVAVGTSKLLARKTAAPENEAESKE